MVVRIGAPTLKLGYREPLSIVFNDPQEVEESSLAAFVKELVGPHNNGRKQGPFDDPEERGGKVQCFKSVALALLDVFIYGYGIAKTLYLSSRR